MINVAMFGVQIKNLVGTIRQRCVLDVKQFIGIRNSVDNFLNEIT